MSPNSHKWLIKSCRCAPSLLLTITPIISSHRVTLRTGSKASCGIIWTPGLEIAQLSTCWKFGRTRRVACSGIDLLVNKVWTSLTGTILRKSGFSFLQAPKSSFMFCATLFKAPNSLSLWLWLTGYDFTFYNDPLERYSLDKYKPKLTLIDAFSMFH